ncbi:tRNA 2-selenouridine(34) synthase MnmH [Acetohalobium arabaticum]|uniref:tRNA 2-selenouridine synthase n=1 Tax=Acetohalobium arabaticum (strain ATCC 49924 / DSM 5501 / Z-7288) TaxID=574087 RepID=D9QQR8_ACEAZ|nr:tRNA 2-selenouridine(34) synthase MnmH [Acetohalobium arabaticum]ADL12859.1 tRNA 2-selenouridine synthase [Acetohalobium arabaticum DSM 5501]
MELITYQETLAKDSLVYVDVRSPKEFAESTIPEAVNIPVFNNEERDEIGTTYVQESPMKARMLGIDLLSPKLPRLVKEIKALTDEYSYVVLFCARGGLRSESIGVITELIGVKLYKLEGGYKSYRHFILDQLEDYELESDLLVIHGNTGVGKTELLYSLQEKEVPIIDLEGLANHRGSAFGGIGLGKPTNQKHFDSLLWERLEELNGAELIAVEAESKRIGMSVLPEFFLQAMEEGIHILIESTLEARVNRIYKEYAVSYEEDPDAFIDRWLESLTAIKKHIIKKAGKDEYKRLVKLSKAGELKKVIRTLLTEYYDPLYEYSQRQHDSFALRTESDDIPEITEEIIDFLG